MDGTSPPRRRWRTALALCIAVPLVLAVTFFVSMQMLARDQATRLGLPGSKNSIQHAYAAAETYAWLRMVGFGSGTATEAVVRLGYLNEYFENGIRSRDDSTAEIYKDLNNNLSGIIAAAWLEQCPDQPPASRLETIGELAKTKAIFYFANDKRIPKLPAAPDLNAAITTFETDRAEIASRVSNDLKRLQSVCSAAHPS
jgi:hypothetical protein